VERLSGKPVELGPVLPEGQGSGGLVDVAVSCQAGACPSGVGFQSFHMELEPCWAWWVAVRGVGSGCPKCSW
jgi:hypothetical protein